MVVINKHYLKICNSFFHGENNFPQKIIKIIKNAKNNAKKKKKIILLNYDLFMIV